MTYRLHTTQIINGVQTSVAGMLLSTCTLNSHFLTREMRFKSKLLIHQNTMSRRQSFWKKFQERYPKADLSRFTQKDWFGDNDTVYFKSKDGKEMIQVFDKSMSNKYYFPNEIKKALGHPAVSATHHSAINLSNFPQELTLNSKPKLPVPALGHADKPQSFNFSNLEIFVTPTDSFVMYSLIPS